MKEIVEKISQIAKILRVEQTRSNLVFIQIEKTQLIPTLTFLRDVEGFTFFVLLSVVDWIEENEFELTYLLNHPEKKIDLGLLVRIPRENPVMDSAHHLWEQIWAYQREIKEMYGIDFPGSPRVEENFLLEGWDNIPPMRRDFDTLKYARETFAERPGRKTYDPATYMKQKLYPDEE